MNFSSLYYRQVGAGSVAKEPTREIRAFPHCEHVTNVEIEYRLDKVLETNWTMRVFTRQGGNMLRTAGNQCD